MRLAGRRWQAEQIIAAVRPAAYEIYEPVRDWLPFLRRLPNVVERPADGHSLGDTRLTYAAGIQSVVPLAWIAELREHRGLPLLGQHFLPVEGALTDVLVFRRKLTPRFAILVPPTIGPTPDAA